MSNSESHLLSIYDKKRRLIKPLPFSRSLAERFLWRRAETRGIHKTKLESGEPFYIYQGVEGLSKAIWLNGYYEKNTTELVSNILEEGEVFVDIGANIGYFTIVSAKEVGSEGEVYSYEPVSQNLDLLRKNIEVNELENVSVRNKLVSGSSGERSLGISKRKGQHSVKGDFSEEEMVKSVKLDEELERRISLVKIDVEGAELEVIEGGMETIRRDSPEIILEYNRSKWDTEKFEKIFSEMNELYEFYTVERAISRVTFEEIISGREISKNIYLAPKSP
jgi:FkbM family methyltransferase